MGQSNERETLTDAERFEKAMQAILAVPPEKAEAIRAARRLRTALRPTPVKRDRPKRGRVRAASGRGGDRRSGASPPRS